MRKAMLSSFLLILLIAYTAGAQASGEKQVKYGDEPFSVRTSYGFFGHFGYNAHIFPSTGLAGCLTCNPVEYGTGGGFGYDGGLFISFPLSESMELSFRLGYANLSGELSAIETILAADPNGNGVPGESEHTLEGTFNSAFLTPLLGFRLSDQLTLSAGLRAGYLLTKQYDQIEKIVSPSYGVFTNDAGDNLGRERNHFSGDIPDAANPASIEAAITAGLSYDLPLNDSYTLFLVPEVFASLGITPLATDWTVNTLTGGVALKWAPRKIIPPALPPLPPPDAPLPAPPEPPELFATIIAKSVDENGNETDITTINVRETLKRQVYPLLNYIFFDDNSDLIPSRYVRNSGMTEQERNSFSVNSLYGLENIDVYYQILNVVGRRMIAYPIANLTLTGCNSNQGAEKNNRDLSKRRAESIKNYLVKEWGIDDGRIKIEPRNLPDLPSNETNPDGIAENRRVEMTSDYISIFEPLVVRDTQVVTNPPLLRFKPKVDADVGVASWKIITAQESSGELKVFSGEGDVPSMLEWDLKNEKQYVPRFDEPFLYRLEVVDKDNKVLKSDVQRIPVQAVTTVNKFMLMLDGTIKSDTEYDQYTLISFGFDKDELTAAHQPIIADAKKRITTESSQESYTFDTKITGHTDRIGDEARNVDLSKRRALNAASALAVPASNAAGVGEANPFYDNNTPEGRFYNRNVQIDVKTTIELK